jgi:hypothetical protein
VPLSNVDLRGTLWLLSVCGGSVSRVSGLQDDGRLSGKVEFRIIGPGSGRVVDQTDVPGLRATETGHPAGQEGACHGLSCDVRNGDDFWPSCETVDCSEAVCVSC